MSGWLFVCTGNICRSPMAAGMFRAAIGSEALARGWDIDSAGVHALVGREPEPSAVAVAARYGANIAGGRARAFGPDDFERFDHIVAMDRGHLDLLSFLRPEAYAGSITLLPARGGTGSIEVPDPYGREPEYYVEVGRLIAEGVSALVERARRG